MWPTKLGINCLLNNNNIEKRRELLKLRKIRCSAQGHWKWSSKMQSRLREFSDQSGVFDSFISVVESNILSLFRRRRTLMGVAASVVYGNVVNSKILGSSAVARKQLWILLGNAGNGRGVRTCTSVLRLLACYSLQFDASKKERSTQIFFVGRLFARGKKK